MNLLRVPTDNYPYRYRPTMPIKASLLPADIRWHYSEAPPNLVENMPGVPRSKQIFGVIATNRPIDNEACEHAHLEPVS